MVTGSFLHSPQQHKATSEEGVEDGTTDGEDPNVHCQDRPNGLPTIAENGYQEVRARG